MALTLDNRDDWRIVDGTFPEVILERPTTVKDAGGGPRTAFAAVASCVGDLQPARGPVRERFAQLGIVVSHTLYLNAEVGALAGDRFRIGARLFTTVEGGYAPDDLGLTGWPATADVQEILGGV